MRILSPATERACPCHPRGLATPPSASQVAAGLGAGRPARLMAEVTLEEWESLRPYALITAMPVLYVANVGPSLLSKSIPSLPPSASLPALVYWRAQKVPKYPRLGALQVPSTGAPWVLGALKKGR